MTDLGEEFANQGIEETKAWLNQVVIGLNFCPFAKREVLRNSIRFTDCDTKKSKEVLSSFAQEVLCLDKNAQIETTLMILTGGFKQFFSYLDIVDLTQTWLDENGYSGVYQIASFHPDYVFEGEPENSPANYTNRSPYPMLHLLREEGLDKAIRSYKNPEQIPQNNINKAHNMGETALKALLLSCMKP
ncbi:DUF1415 domain-containing protein [Aliiglaciecola sp. 3_MG-2023]|uniref:DUF1415 domain-containing protein n=1 Tax=Aliiglaciecola sp. 3_MG-2023 TaxID=3062644 RepID=UPI0026E2E70C|nr:DUF1415 domain-containing protein [Aliiglaciecola sp. 3_MG-2023]MDO6694057.1 DUF1415 domain-containing protein [Aliiglaciecola sp. 3_MG-2023]